MPPFRHDNFIAHNIPMETIGHLPRRRLTKLYSDTKRSCDIVTKQDRIEDDPELRDLHRKFRIQKDRYIAWGLEWSDESDASQCVIDESVALAGLTETVDSILETIKNTLDEAERLQKPRKVSTPTLVSEKGTPIASRTWSASDRTRYENLANDLATSIDVLYDLSRSRRSFRQGSFPMSLDGKGATDSSPSSTQKSSSNPPSFSSSEITLISSSSVPGGSKYNAFQRPQKIERKDLNLPQEEPPPYDSVPAAPTARVVGHLRQHHTSTNPWKSAPGKTLETAVLVEYHSFDPVYRTTGVSPPLERLERLLDVLELGVGRFGDGAGEPGFGTLKCVGYFEDPQQPRFGLVYELPTRVYSGPSDSRALLDLKPATLRSALQAASKSFNASNTSFSPVVPPLEDRFRLALNICLTFSKLHGEGFQHKDLSSNTILVFKKALSAQTPSSRQTGPDCELRSPYVSAFDLFSEYDVEAQSRPQVLDIYKHPEYDASISGSNSYEMRFDIYALGLILLEIGLWMPLADLFKPKYTLLDFKIRLETIWVKKLAGKCGTAYMHAVQDCFTAADRKFPYGEPLPYDRTLLRLQRCCALDDSDYSPSQTSRASSQDDYQGSAPAAHSGTPANVTSTPRSTRKRRAAPEPPLSPVPEARKPKGSPGSSLARSASQSISKTASHFTTNLHHLPLITRESGDEQMDWEAIRGDADFGWDQYGHSGFGVGGFPHEDRSMTPRPNQVEYDGGAVCAACTIQRAWRARRDKPSLKDYRRKVTIVQSLWRGRRERISKQERKQSHAYPTPTPEPDMRKTLGSTIYIPPQDIPADRPKLKLYPGIKFSPELTTDWHQKLLPRLERIIERTLKDSPETVSIDLVAVGEAQTTARPTIFVTCTSTAKVRAVINKKLQYDHANFDLKVRKGKIRRSKLTRPTKTTHRSPEPHRSMMNDSTYEADMPALNPFHQQRPLCGASIGAYKDEHLPPVSYGGVVMVDNEPYGMSVHHLLDAPSDDEEEPESPEDTVRSSARGSTYNWLAAMDEQPTLQDAPEDFYPLEISDDDLDADDDDVESLEIPSDSESDDDSVRDAHGDIEGVEAGEGEDIKITQPAIDDVDDEFFPSPEDRDEDHLDSHELGHVYASSGIRRLKRDGIIHEIDWSLLKVNDDRIQPYNLVQGGKRYCPNSGQDPCPRLSEPVCRRNYSPDEDEYPIQVAKADALGSLAVHCFGRTSGLKAGIVGEAMSSVRIYRRRTFSRSWYVIGGFGVGGDSGAWVIDNQHGRVCGHVLAWCERNRVAYICPMEVLFEDIKNTLGATRVCLPGAEGQGKENENLRAEQPPAYNLPDLRRLNLEDQKNDLRRSRLSMEQPVTPVEIVGGGVGQFA